MNRPDVETSSAEYARRFAGPGGAYLLGVQATAVSTIMSGLASGSALDVGGAHGQLLDLLEDNGWQVTVQGSDPICATNLRQVHGKRPSAFVASELLELPFADRSFDLVLAVRLLAHMPEWRRLLAEMCRVARSTVIIDYPPRSGLSPFTPLIYGAKKAFEKNTRPFLSFSNAEVRAELLRHGFGGFADVRQLLLPMVLHRMANGATALRTAERTFGATGLTRLAGAPIVVRADRIGS